MHAFDGRTDRQTDRIPIAIPRLHSMQRGKNKKWLLLVICFKDLVVIMHSLYWKENGRQKSARQMCNDDSYKKIKTAGKDKLKWRAMARVTEES